MIESHKTPAATDRPPPTNDSRKAPARPLILEAVDAEDSKASEQHKDEGEEEERPEGG